MTTPLIILLMALEPMTVTSYRSVHSQTDTSPHVTSTGEHVHSHGVAVSQDLLCPKAFGKTKRHKRTVGCSGLHYGDWLYIEGVGLKNINDCMNPRHKNRLDVWVSTYSQEKQFGTRKLRVAKVELK